MQGSWVQSLFRELDSTCHIVRPKKKKELSKKVSNERYFQNGRVRGLPTHSMKGYPDAKTRHQIQHPPQTGTRSLSQHQHAETSNRQKGFVRSQWGLISEMQKNKNKTKNQKH